MIFPTYEARFRFDALKPLVVSLSPAETNKIMNWAKTVRTLRLRLKLNQEAFAALIGVSQTYVSRVESGYVTPKQSQADAILKLKDNPRTRSVFDDFVSTIHHSPYPCCLVETAGPDGFQIVALSPPLRLGGHGPALVHGENQPGLGLCKHLQALQGEGFFDGQLSLATARIRCDQRHRSWSVQYTPIRDEIGQWYAHAIFHDSAHHEDEPAETFDRFEFRRFGRPD